MTGLDNNLDEEWPLYDWMLWYMVRWLTPEGRPDKRLSGTGPYADEDRSNTREVQMSTEAQIRPRQTFITDYVQEFRETKNVLVLLKAFALVLKQQRTLELIYGGYCRLFHRPSPVYPWVEGAALPSILEQCESVPQGIVSREALIQRFGGAFKVGLLPHDFQSARTESVCHDDMRLIIGEYGEHPRIACVTS
jgi:hypothetical protein